MRPTLASSCAVAATAAEARFRINAPAPAPRTSRIVALDGGAAEVIERLARDANPTAHFLTYKQAGEIVSGNGALPDVVLHSTDGTATVHLRDELDGADMVFMVATADDGADAAAAIGEACKSKGVMTGAVVFGEEENVKRAVAALRPNAYVLLVTQDEDDVAAVLQALRA